MRTVRPTDNQTADRHNNPQLNIGTDTHIHIVRQICLFIAEQSLILILTHSLPPSFSLPSGSKYPSPDTLRWDRPHYDDGKFVHADSEGSDSEEVSATERKTFEQSAEPP
jgi:hypothetical protein